MRNMRIPARVAGLAVVVAACGGGIAVDVEGPWARTSPMMTTAGAVYMELVSADGDQLLAASVDPSVAATVEIHETVMHESMDDMGGDDAMDDMEGMGEMRMQEVESIDLPAGETVILEPGGYHVMLLDLAEPLELGETFELTLTFATAGDQTVTVEVRDSAP